MIYLQTVWIVSSSIDLLSDSFCVIGEFLSVMIMSWEIILNEFVCIITIIEEYGLDNYLFVYGILQREQAKP